MSDVVYCIDTSSLIDLRRWRPFKSHPEVWKRLDGLIKQERLLAPSMVLQELQRKDDALVKWGRKRTKMFRKNSSDIVERVQQILRRFPDLVDADQPTQSADPFVVALALKEASELYAEEVIVVTEEKYAPGKARIPHVCEAYKLKYLTIHQVFLFEKLEF